MALVDLSNAYVLARTGEELDQATGLPFEDVDLTTAQQGQVYSNIGQPATDNEPTDGSDNLAKSGGIYSWTIQQLATAKEITGIAVTTMPTKTYYMLNEELDLTGIVVSAVFADGTTADVTSACTFYPAAGSAVGINGYNTIEVTYAYGLATAKTTFEVTATTPYVDFWCEDSFTIQVANPSWSGTIQYSVNGGSTWNVWDGSALTPSFWHFGNHILFRGTGNLKIAGGVSYNWNITQVEGAEGVHVCGDIRMLLDYQNPTTASMNTYCFANMLSDNPIIEAPMLLATSLPEQCYYSMFSNCTSLVTPPKLPATSLNKNCYYRMFYGCSALQTAPELPATTMSYRCYQEMFYGCSSLKTPPVLPATTLAEGCYYGMFQSCTSLETLPALSTTTLAKSCYGYMFYGCSNINISRYQRPAFPYAWRIPMSGTGVTATDAVYKMIGSTGGPYTASTPDIDTTYYVANRPIVE